MPKKLFEHIYRLHLDIIKELNNSHIILQKIVPIIEKECSILKSTGKLEDKTYYVPSKKGKVIVKSAFRTDNEVKEILEFVAKRELYETTLVTNVSRFESFLFDTLKLILKKFPEKLSTTIQGIGNYKDISLQLILDSDTKQSLMNEIIDNRIVMISYASPQNYLKYFEEITGCKTNTAEFLDYIEIKATRDLLIHNSGMINETYLNKVGKSKRGDIRTAIPINKEYFDFTIATMKSISGLIRKETEAKFKDVK